VYLLNIPNYGTWIGATPEKLLVGEIPIFKMDSLAGSRSLEDPFDWTDKEINEQQMVTNFIEEKLNHSGIKFHKSPTETVQAGNIEHLHTEFVTENCFSPMDLVENLHPTPAVSGIPREPAIDFISQTEKHSRKLYSGIIGIAQEGMYNLFVNLRCAELRKDSVDLFVGGGLTKDSIKEVEWNETEFKSQTLLSVIEKM
jgi:isochorismate synthase